MGGLTTRVARAAPGEDLVVTHTGGIPKKRTIVRFPVVGTVSRATVHNNDLPNVLRGLRERVYAVEGPGGLRCPPRPARGLFNDRLGDDRRSLLMHLRGCQPITSSKFLEHYKGAKRAIYERAVSENLAGGVPRWSAYLNTFVKAEFLNLDAKPDPAPRVIQPRHPRYNAALGRYIQPLEHRAYRAIAKICGGPTVMKGYNAAQVGRIMASAWGEFNSPCGVSLDASRFDQHVSVEALQFEHSIYRGAYSNLTTHEKDELALLLEWQISNRGIARLPEATVKYTVDGNRMSGDMNTALGNCLLMCLMVRSWCRRQGVRFRLMDNGDDATVFMEAADLPLFMDGLKQWFQEMGFTMKVEEPVFTLEHVEFCQTHPVRVGGEWRMVRNPLIAMAKDTLWKCPNRGSQLAAWRWLTAVGDCGAAACSGVPVMQEFYAYLQSHNTRGPTQGFGSGDSGFERMAVGMCRTRQPVDDNARVSFWLAFGITPDTQVQLERHFRGMAPQQPCRQWIEDDTLNLSHIPVDAPNHLL